MPATPRPVGRRRKFADFEEHEAKLRNVITRRPQYCHSIGLYQGGRDSTVWVKVYCPHGAVYRGRHYAAGQSVEVKLGRRASFDWPDMIAERDRLQALADNGLPLEEAEVPTFAKYAEEWLERKKPTLRSYAMTKGNVHGALIPTFGKKPLDAITVGDVNRWIGVQSAKLKPSSVTRYFAVFKAIMNDAIRSGIIGANPAEKADKIRGVEPRQRFVTEGEWKTIVETAERIEAEQEAKKEQTPQQIRGWLRHYVVWAYESGMRRSEILALTWANVRSAEGAATRIEVKHTKTAKPRHVACTAEMESILVALAKLERLPEDDRLFPVSMMTLKRSLSRLFQETGLPDVRLHDLRRTHTTILMQLGIDSKAIAGRLGHASINMIDKHYAVYQGDSRAANAFDARRAGKNEQLAAPEAK